MAEGLAGSIGIFDSGIGGLSFVQAIQKELPEESLHYFADLKNLPYGEKTKEQVVECARQVAERLHQKQAKVFIVACSTASAVAVPVLHPAYDQPVVGVLNPFFLNEILTQTETKKVGVVSTRLTHQSGMFRQWIQAADPAVEVFSAPASELVNAISVGDLTQPRLKELVAETLELFYGVVDVLVLGCTHFNFVEPLFQAESGSSLKMVSAPVPTAKYVRQLLTEREALALKGPGELRIETSQFDPGFDAFVARFWPALRSVQAKS